jgi:hypothetical protein
MENLQKNQILLDDECNCINCYPQKFWQFTHTELQSYISNFPYLFLSALKTRDLLEHSFEDILSNLILDGYNVDRLNQVYYSINNK